MKILLTSLFTVSLVSAGFAAVESTHLAGRENKTPGPPGYAAVTDNDKQIERAVMHARKSLGFFVAALQAKKSGDTGFEVKKAFVDGDKVEHLWIGELSFDGKNFHGRVNNRPHDVKNVKLGQPVVVAPREVGDWMFIKGGKLMGGCTTRVLYSRLTPEQKAQFNKEADFKIE